MYLLRIMICSNLCSTEVTSSSLTTGNSLRTTPKFSARLTPVTPPHPLYGNHGSRFVSDLFLAHSTATHCFTAWCCSLKDWNSLLGAVKSNQISWLKLVGGLKYVLIVLPFGTETLHFIRQLKMFDVPWNLLSWFCLSVWRTAWKSWLMQGQAKEQ